MKRTLLVVVLACMLVGCNEYVEVPVLAPPPSEASGITRPDRKLGVLCKPSDFGMVYEEVVCGCDGIVCINVRNTVPVNVRNTVPSPHFPKPPSK